jgi:DNA modification methylase
MEATWQTSDGRVRLYLGDCRDILPTLEVDVVITDPPYEITAAGGGIVATRKDLHETEGFTDCGFDYGLLAQFDNWVCFGTLRQVPKLIASVGKRRWMLITWNKPNPCPLVNGNYLPDTEYIIHAWSKGQLFGGFNDKARFIVHPLGDKEHGEHPNEKPMRVMRKLVSLASDEGHTVLDPFMGSGTTGVACLRIGRRFIGIERDPKWFQVAVDRIKSELNRAPLFDESPEISQAELF